MCEASALASELAALNLVCPVSIQLEPRDQEPSSVNLFSIVSLIPGNLLCCRQYADVKYAKHYLPDIQERNSREIAATQSSGML